MKDPIYINHYYVQSYESYLRRKINRPRDDTGESRELGSKEEFHQCNNDVTNEIIKNKYSNLIKIYISQLKNNAVDNFCIVV